MFSHHNQVKAQIDQFLDIITRYHTSDDLLRRAEQLVPISDLLERIPDLNTDNNDDFRESLLPLVADWFSEDFFTWYDQPECQECPNSPEMNQIVRRRRGDIMVEYYQCPNYANCKQASEFARHNDPGILLETRTGRCGEWANCFYLILRSLDFDARLVVDFTDHVWCEVWSERRQCWLHVNPGEGAIDQPLMYEAGWKKNLTYCIAFSPFEVQDVTWRYVIDLKQTCSRRNLCDEDWLARYLVICTEKLICGCSETFKDMIRKRKLLELLSFIRTPENYIRKVTADDLVQRKTGSLAWRVARGEFSTQMSCHNIVAIKTIDTNLIRHSKSTIYTMRYNCCKDVYTCTYNQSTTKPSWLSLVYEAKNVARKFEKDWKIAYISRYESCPASQPGEITWRFDLREIEDIWERIEIYLSCQPFPDTTIDILFIGHDGDEKNAVFVKSILHNQLITINSSDVNSRGNGINFFDINVELKGGNIDDNVAWQKPQLFRQSNKTQSDMNVFSLEIF